MATSKASWLKLLRPSSTADWRSTSVGSLSTELSPCGKWAGGGRRPPEGSTAITGGADSGEGGVCAVESHVFARDWLVALWPAVENGVPVWPADGGVGIICGYQVVGGDATYWPGLSGASGGGAGGGH